MTYIIADPDYKSCADLKRLLDEDKTLVFKGSYTTLSAAEVGTSTDPPDLAFIRLRNAALNAVKLASTLRAQNPLSKVIFIGSQKEDAVEAFEYEADGFLLIPFSKKKIGQWLILNTGITWTK